MKIHRVDIGLNGASTLMEVLDARKRGGCFSVNWKSTIDLSVPVHCVTSLGQPFFTNRLLAVATCGAQSIYTRGHQLDLPDLETLDQREDYIFEMMVPFWPDISSEMGVEYEAIRKRLAWRYSLARAVSLKASRNGIDIGASALLKKIKQQQSQFEGWL